MYVHAGNGISIPSSYTSHLSPVSSAKLHALVSQAIDKEKVNAMQGVSFCGYTWN